MPPDDNQKKFVEQYVDAVNSKDIQKLKELIHPKCLAVMTETNRDYYDLLFKNEFQIAIPPDYKVKVEEFVKNPALGKLATASLPAPPTHRLQILFPISPRSRQNRIILVANEGDRYFDILPVPTAKMLETLRANQAGDHKPK